MTFGIVFFWIIMLSLSVILLKLYSFIPQKEAPHIMPHKPVSTQTRVLGTYNERLLSIIPMKSGQDARDYGILFFAVLAFYMIIARFSYENSRAKLRERGDAVR